MRADTTALRWQCKPFEQLSTTELYGLLSLRARVFVLEQACSYLDPDGFDLQVLHLFGQHGHSGELLACARILPPLTKGPQQPELMIGRVATAPAARGAGIGRALMERALQACEQHWPGRAVEIQAQAYLQGFYASLGFRPISEVYPDDGIAHIDMRRDSAPA